MYSFRIANNSKQSQIPIGYRLGVGVRFVSASWAGYTKRMSLPGRGTSAYCIKRAPTFRHRMPGHCVSKDIFKNSRSFEDYICPECNLLLKEPVQLVSCGHRLCKSCADELHAPPRCPAAECEELCDIEDDGAYVSTQN